ncbi:GTP pyrophosphokinase family protein [Salipaludibacillus sp. CUR1]|uniref:GTP pyrophosphokinase n=1 Tax=Salipaludibacillus sp. CUR1 TaxID=2820003 RepID=UPI001E58AA32|nr:GTP pyrophosphokinase family protein [Salipaludibacillus sp. CUR1]MCE7794441.1 GTP pyrophosphokinase family protein [Salipaludibacillus sp. CUR1]
METAAPINMRKLKAVKKELTRFMMTYQFALDELNTKIDILQQEFHYIHDYNPIEHVKSRIKTPESIMNKVWRKGCDLTIPSIRENIQDIAGVRISCAFLSDIYEISDMLERQKDIHVVEKKDYIAHPKPNGYQSLHLILEIPVFMSDRVLDVYVEVQIRTIAMDFWASLEHKIYYKYNKDAPPAILQELKEAAETAAHLDIKMERIHKEINEYKDNDSNSDLIANNERFRLPREFLSSYINAAR